MTDIASLGIKVDYSSIPSASDALARLKSSASDAASASARLQSSTLAAREGFAAVKKALDEHTSSLGLNRMQMLESAHLARSLADSFMAGVSPMRALAMEGARIAQIFAEGSGGVGGTLKAMTTTVGRLATGWVGLGAAVAAGAGIAGAALVRFQRQQDALALSLNGAGRYAGVSLAGISSIANPAGAANPMLGQGGATVLAAALARTGRISGAIMPGILSAAAPYARATGQDIGPAGEQLAKAFADPAKGAAALSERLGFLDGRNRELIQTMEASGDTLGAQRLLLSEVANAAKQASDRTWGLTDAWQKLKAQAGRAMDRAGGAIANSLFPDLQHQRAAYQNDLDRQKWFGGVFGNAAAAAEDRREIALIDAELKRQEGAAKKAGSDAASRALSLQASDAVDATSPLSARMRKLDANIALFRKTLADPMATSLTPGGAGSLAESLERAQNQRANLDPIERTRRDSALSVQAIEAQTAAERTLVEARRAELDVLRNAGTAAEAAAKSLATWNDAIARSNSETENALRSAQDRLSLVGKTPYERDLLETRFRARDLMRNAVTGIPAGAIVVPPAPAAVAPGRSPYGDLSSSVSIWGADSYRKSIAAIETPGGGYGTLGPVTRSGDRAYGKYQIMGANIGPWSKATFGRAMTTDEFLRDPSAQDAIFDHQFGGYVRRYGQRDAASMWLTGRTLANGGAGARDQNGTTGATYANRFMAGIGANPAGAALAPGNIAIPSTAARNVAGFVSASDQASYQDRFLEPMRQGNLELTRSEALLRARAAAFGQDAAAMAKSNAEAEMWAKLQQQGYDAGKLNAAQISQVTKAVGDYGTHAAQYQKEQQDFQRRQDMVSGFNDFGRQFTGGAANDLFSTWNTNPRDLVGQLSTGGQARYYAGQLSGGQVRSMVAQRQVTNLFRQMMFNQGVSMIQNGLFGNGKSGSNGLLGGLFNGLLGGLGFGGGSGGAATTGTVAGLGSLWSDLAGFAAGGIMTSNGPLALRRYASGGVADAPQLAMFGEGSRPEAYVPLADGRTIPVTMKAPSFGGGGSAIPTAAPQITLGGHTIVIQGNADDKAIAQLRAEFATSQKQMVSSLQRNLGTMMAHWQNNYG